MLHAPGFTEWAGLYGKNLNADYEFLFARHWRYFDDSEHARAAVELVLSYPEQVRDMNDGRNASFVGFDEITRAKYIELRSKKSSRKRNHIRSIFQISPEHHKKTGTVPGYIRPCAKLVPKRLQAS